MLYLRLFYEFFKTGLFAVGGGMATIPFLYEMADSTGWFSYDDLANMVAVGESTPGPIGVNMATYVGFVTGMNDSGILGAIFGAVTATLGLITPSVIIILIIAAVLNSFRNNPFVERAFYGLRPASTGLIAAAGIGVVISNLFYAGQGFALGAVNWKGWILAVVIWVLSNKAKWTKKLHPIVFIGISALAGILFSMG
ncbi:MAG: chromate transporter [Oscillospiraceae bacterium]|nr:chromate transporter [Oscillospiraceae bacterium]